MFWMVTDSSDNIAKEQVGSSVKYEGYTRAEYGFLKTSFKNNYRHYGLLENTAIIIIYYYLYNTST